MSRWCSLTLFLVSVCFLPALPETKTQTLPISTGLITGITGKDGVRAYLGIPFAAPPVGELRWRPPQAPAAWKGVRNADHFGPGCMQFELGSRLPWTEEFMAQGPISEDCLFVNVWTAATSDKEKRAVMVFIYGGGFTEGSGAVAVYNGAQLAKKGVVAVNFNYRVGPLGFLVFPELTQESEHHSSGNYGLLDQIAALAWVHKNIRAFGGDPDKVTIFGQSAGAISVDDLMRSPLAQGLFVRAIAQSGPGLFPRNILGGGMSLAQREREGVKYAELMGAHSLAQLRAIPAQDFFKPAAGTSSGPPRVGGPVIDGWVLPKDDPEPEVPLIVGMVSGDAALGRGFPRASTPTVSAYEGDMQKKYGDKAAAFLKLYPASEDNDVVAVKKAAQIDQSRVSIDVWSANIVKRSGRVYTYYFDHPIPWPAHPEFGAFHSAELPYIFETLNVLDRPWQAIDYKLSDILSSYWTNQDWGPQWLRPAAMADVHDRPSRNHGTRRSPCTHPQCPVREARILLELLEEMTRLRLLATTPPQGRIRGLQVITLCPLTFRSKSLVPGFPRARCRATIWDGQSN